MDGEPLSFAEPKHYLLLNKPADVLSTRHDPQGRATVMQLVPQRLRRYLYPVGRLDMDAEGLLLLTNDGELAHALTHPSFEIPKTYLATVQGQVSRDELQALRAGVELKDGPAAADVAEIVELSGDSTVLSLTLHEGRKREVKRLCQAVGHRVIALQRVSLGPLELGQLQPGKYRALSAEEIEQLYAATGLRREGDDGT